MALQPYSDEQLNYFKFLSIVLNEFPKALRRTFKTMWDNTVGHRPGFQLWDDSIVVRNLFASKEGAKTKVPIHQSYNEWDCTALFQATIYARSFAIHHTTLSNLYVKPRGVPHGSFHTSVMSPGGNNAETFALAIDQLRLLRNSMCHSTSSEMDKITFDRYVKHAKDAFKALGVSTAPIDAVGSLTESDFPTSEVRKLEIGIREETRAYIKFLEGMSSDIEELKALSNAIKQTMDEGMAKKEDIAMLEQKINDLIKDQRSKNSDTTPKLPKTFLQPMVPNFTGRQSECEEIIGHVTSESTRIVSIWGSPGFGKTSVAIAVGHDLHSQGLPVYFLSLRGLQSKADLTSKLLGLVRQPAKNAQPSFQRLSLDDKLCQLFSEVSEQLVVILDNADDLLESGLPKVKEEVMQLLEEILRRNARMTFVVTTRESFEFMNVHFQGHHSVRTRPLDEAAAHTLVHELLQEASASECTRITQICGNVPLAIKLLCSLISEDSVPPSQFLDEFTKPSSESIVEMLDNPDYPTSHRLQFLFDSSFHRLTLQEKEALVSSCILPEDFDTEVAAAVLGNTRIFEAKKILKTLQRKLLLDSSWKPGSFTMHKLLQSFARDKGECQMKETVLIAKARLNAFYILRFEKLNEQFLTGHSMTAFIAFYEDRNSIVQSLIEGCSDSKTANGVFDVLVKAELFLDSLFLNEGTDFYKIYNTAIVAAKKLEANEFYYGLLVSKAFGEVYNGYATQLLSEAKEIEALLSTVSMKELKGKRLCYLGIDQLVSGKTEVGIQSLQEALTLMHGNQEQIILRLVAFQILATFCLLKDNTPSSNQYFCMAESECKAAGDTQLLIIPTQEIKGKETSNDNKPQWDTNSLLNQPLKLEIAFLVSKAAKTFTTTHTKQYVSNVVHQILKEIETKEPVSKGLFNFHRNVVGILNAINETENSVTLFSTRITYYQTALNQCKEKSTLYQIHHEALAKCYLDLGLFHQSKENYSEALHAHHRALDITIKLFGEEHADTAYSYHNLGTTQHSLGDFTSALESVQRSLHIRLKLFGEEHADTARSYHNLGATQHSLGDFTSALDSAQRSLDIRLKLFGEEHADTAHGYYSLGITQHSLGDFTSALDSAQRSLHIRLKLFGEEHADTAHGYYSLGITQHSLGDFTSALDSAQRSLHIRLKLFGEEHADTAHGYYSLGITQHSLGDFTSALDSAQRSLHIRLKLFGEEHADTAHGYYSLGITQHSLGDFTSALESKQRSLHIRLKLFGEEHADTAHGYYSLGITQHSLGDFTSALESKQRSLHIRLKLFGEEHADTAYSYHNLGTTQHSLGDFTSALESNERSLHIRLKLFGEEHADTAYSYHNLGATQHSLGDFTSALESNQRSLHIRLKLLGEEHAVTALSYYSLGITQHSLGDFTSALESKQRSLHIRLKLFGEEHADTADSYYSLGITQHSLRDFTSALESDQRSLHIRLKLFGEEHADTADSYYSLGITQHSLGDYTSALESNQRSLHIRLKLFGEEHADTARSYCSLGTTQHSLGDFTSALESNQRSLHIRLKLLGEEHAVTALSYYSLGITQHSLGDFTSALESKQRSLHIRLKLFGEEHADTARIYCSLGTTQHSLGDFTSALESNQRSLHIRLKLFGEEHADTARNYYSLGITQHSLRDFTSALESDQRSLHIRLKLFGEEHEDTALSYESLGITQHSLRDFTSALESNQRSLKLFGEEHADTALSYESLGITQLALGDFTAAHQSLQRALEIRRCLIGEQQ